MRKYIILLILLLVAVPALAGMWVDSGGIQFEGSTADDYETTLTVTDPTADNVITLPNSNATIGTASGLSSSTDYGDFSTNGSGSAALDADVVAAAEMGDADHGDVAWSGGSASVEAVDDDVALDGSLQYNTTTVTGAGPTDDLDVSGSNVVFIDTSSNNVTIGGATGGVAGQMLQIVIVDATNNATIEHQELSGAGQFNLVDAGDQEITNSFGGWTFVSNGTEWFEIDHD